MVWPGPMSLAIRTAPAMLTAVDPPHHQPLVPHKIKDIGQGLGV